VAAEATGDAVSGHVTSDSPMPVEEPREEPSTADLAPLAAPPAVSTPQIPEPIAAARPIVVPPAVAPATMSIDELQPILEQAGLTLVQTEPAKLAGARAKVAVETAPIRVPRERPVLPPLDAGPLVQVETRRAGVSPQ
jgi:ribonuclease E